MVYLEDIVGLAEKTTGQVEENEVGTSDRGARGGGGPPLQVPSIDALLGDIYELRYQVSQLSARMYTYRAKRDTYHHERDEVQTFAQTGGAITSIWVTNPPSIFIQGILQQRDYYSSIMQTWLIGVPPYTPGKIYPVPPITYFPIDVLVY